MDRFLSLHTSVSTQLMKRILFQGFILAFFGVAGLVYAGVFIDLAALRHWGWAVFLVSLSLIAFGMLPYRRLSRLQMNPNVLRLNDAENVNYYVKGNLILTLPLHALEKVEFVEKGSLYGIAIRLKQLSSPCFIVHHNRKEVDALRKTAHQLAAADLFLPYFNRRAYHEFIDWL